MYRIYTGMKLYYFEDSTPNMGHIPLSTITNVDFSFTPLKI